MASVIWLMAYGDTQADKNARIKEIRAVYAQAKKKIDMNGKNGKSPKDMNITKNHLIDEEICIYDMESLDYYFDESTVTSYFDDMTRPARCYYTYSYIFDDSTIRTGSNNDIRLLKLSDGKFTCVSQIGWKYTGKDKNPIPHYMYFKYKKMTDKELQDYRDKYTTDFESLLNKGE